jgi:hypothetical protein
MPTKKEASEKQQAAEGVALRITEQSDRYKDGVPVAVPTDASAATEPKSGQQAATPKEQ